MQGDASDRRIEIATADAPRPAGTYAQAIVLDGVAYLAGQTARLPDGTYVADAPFEAQVRQTLDNLQAVARACGASLADAVRVTVYLKDPARRTEFDAVYAAYVGTPPPARAIVQSTFDHIELEVDAIVAVPIGEAAARR